MVVWIWLPASCYSISVLTYTHKYAKNNKINNNKVSLLIVLWIISLTVICHCWGKFSGSTSVSFGEIYRENISTARSQNAVLSVISYHINLCQSSQGKLVDQFKLTTPFRKVILNACEAEEAEVTSSKETLRICKTITSK